MDRETGMYYYGARYYDPRISIFISVDPLAEQFVGWTPYHYVHQNPVNMIDPNGKNGIIVVQGNNIIVKTRIYITGYGATKEKAKLIEKGIKEYWGKTFSFTDKAYNKEYKVTFDIRVDTKPTDQEGIRELMKSVDEGSYNVVNLVDESKNEYRSKVLPDGYRGSWGEDEPNSTYAHEFGHFLGIGDMYYLDSSKKITNYQGVEEYDIMGKNIHNKKTNVSQENIDAIGAKALSRKDFDEKIKIGRSHGQIRSNKDLCE